MGSGFKDWTAGDVLTAADVDGYLMRQTVMTFADASARDTALSGVLDEGMVAYLEDVNALTVYNGSAWVAVIDSDVLTVDTANDRVGINDSTPSYALDVTGDINASSNLRVGGTLLPSWMIGCANGSGWVYNPADVGNNYYSPGAGASVTLTTGTSVLVIIHADWAHVGGKTDYWSVNVTGASTISPNDANAIVYTNSTSHRITTGIAFCLTVTAGSNTFKNEMKNVTGSYAQTVYYNRLQIVRLN